MPLFLVLVSLWCHLLPLSLLKLTYFVEHNIGYQLSKFQCFRLSLPNLTVIGNQFIRECWTKNHDLREEKWHFLNISN